MSSTTHGAKKVKPFDSDLTLWHEFLEAWPIERLRTMSLENYTQAGSKDTFTYWMESRLDKYGSIWGGSAFKFGIYSRDNTSPKKSGSGLEYDDEYGWYSRLGDTRQGAFQAVRGHVVSVAEAARAGKLEEIDDSPLGAVYRWKIAFHYQSMNDPLIACIFTRKPLLHALHLPLNDTEQLQSALYRDLAKQRAAGEGIDAFSNRVWRQWIRSNPYEVKLSARAVRDGYLAIKLASSPFPEAMFGGPDEKDAGDTASFVTDTGLSFTTDIRVPGAGGVGTLRESMAQYFQQIGAKTGDVIRIVPRDDGSFLIDRKGAPAAPTTDIVVPPHASPFITLEEPIHMPLNQILYGPPGTGKTHQTIIKALEILDPDLLDKHDEQDEDGRKVLKQRFDDFVKDGRIQFVTFHQSFSYEDFVEGLRAESNETGQLAYEIADGVFKKMCLLASPDVSMEKHIPIDLKGRTIWKMSLGAANDEAVFDECISNKIILMGYGEGQDFSQCRSREDIADKIPQSSPYGITAIHRLVVEMKKGDIVVVSDGNRKFRAIGQINGDYRHVDRSEAESFDQCRTVEWLKVYEHSLPREALMKKDFTQRTIYELTPSSIDMGKLAELLKPASDASPSRAPRVLIIDEINRGNLSRIFGELITLIEPSKRDGEVEALRVVLPYSKTAFSVPNNVYLIGTMNTADRSLAGIDIALRRRFQFIEMPPKPELLEGVKIAGVDLRSLLETLNQRIEALLDRDHMLGHAYFMSLKGGEDLSGLARVFRNNVLPLLQEYFFEDWQRIAWVLNDHRKSTGHQFIYSVSHRADDLFGKDGEVPASGKLWRVDTQAFDRVESYAGIIQA